MSDEPITLKTAIRSRVSEIQVALLGKNPVRAAAARGALAEWRRATGKAPEKEPVVWGSILGASPVSTKSEALLPERFVGRGDSPSPEEWGAFTALTLYATHQQSQTTGMHQVKSSDVADHKWAPDLSFGHAAGLLARTTGSKSTKGRFDSIVTAQSPDTLTYHLRSFIQLLRTEKIPLDYGALADDLQQLQRPDRRPKVLLRWGRDFAGTYSPPRKEAAATAKKGD